MSQAHVDGFPVDRSVKPTISGADPLVTVVVKSAVGGAIVPSTVTISSGALTPSRALQKTLLVFVVANPKLTMPWETTALVTSTSAQTSSPTDPPVATGFPDRTGALAYVIVDSVHVLGTAQMEPALGPPSVE